MHEFCHTIDAALQRTDLTWRGRLRLTYRDAAGKGLWRDICAGSHQAEYWAEACQCHFDCGRAIYSEGAGQRPCKTVVLGRNEKLTDLPELDGVTDTNIDNAGKLKGNLLLIVGEMDSNVPPESTMRFVDALIKAHKDFDMLEVPGANHGAGSWLTTTKTHDFFLRYLLHEEPTEENATN